MSYLFITLATPVSFAEWLYWDTTVGKGSRSAVPSVLPILLLISAITTAAPARDLGTALAQYL